MVTYLIITAFSYLQLNFVYNIKALYDHNSDLAAPFPVQPFLSYNEILNCSERELFYSYPVVIKFKNSSYINSQIPIEWKINVCVDGNIISRNETIAPSYELIYDSSSMLDFIDKCSQITRECYYYKHDLELYQKNKQKLNPTIKLINNTIVLVDCNNLVLVVSTPFYNPTQKIYQAQVCFNDGSSSYTMFSETIDNFHDHIITSDEFMFGDIGTTFWYRCINLAKDCVTYLT